MAWKICVVFLCAALGAVQCQNNLQRRLNENNLGRLNFPDDVIIGDEIQGIAGVDYPVLAVVPQTGFTCEDFGVPGYYADPASGCQVYYQCQKSGRGVGRLCANGTIFNQETLVCEWWFNVDCSKAVSQYSVNVDVLQAMTDVDLAAGRTQRTPLGARLPGGLPAVNSPLLAGRFNPRLPLLATTRRPFTTLNSRFGAAARATSAFGAAARASAALAASKYNSNANSNYNSNANSNANPNSNANSNYNSNANPNSNANSNYNSNANPNSNANSNSENEREFNGYPYEGKNLDRSYLPPSN